MSTRNEPYKSLLPIEIEIELKNRIEAAAAERDMSLRDYVAAALHDALDSQGVARLLNRSDEWSRLSVPSCARDWESDADAIYDDMA
jgi:hypothetical protein